MVFYVDFDGTCVSQDREYDDVTTPFEFMPYAREGLLSLKAAGHTLVLWSGRANRAMLFNSDLDPLVRAGYRSTRFYGKRSVNWNRFVHMRDFVKEHLPNVFATISDGSEGKPACDRIVDDKAGPVDWVEIMLTHGEPSLALTSLKSPSEMAAFLQPKGK